MAHALLRLLLLIKNMLEDVLMYCVDKMALTAKLLFSLED